MARSSRVFPCSKSSSECVAMAASRSARTVNPFGGSDGRSRLLSAISHSSEEVMSGAYSEPMYCITGNRYLRDSGSDSSRARK